MSDTPELENQMNDIGDSESLKNPNGFKIAERVPCQEENGRKIFLRSDGGEWSYTEPIQIGNFYFHIDKPELCLRLNNNTGDQSKINDPRNFIQDSLNSAEIMSWNGPVDINNDNIDSLSVGFQLLTLEDVLYVVPYTSVRSIMTDEMIKTAGGAVIDHLTGDSSNESLSGDTTEQLEQLAEELWRLAEVDPRANSAQRILLNMENERKDLENKSIIQFFGGLLALGVIAQALSNSLEALNLVTPEGSAITFLLGIVIGGAVAYKRSDFLNLDKIVREDALSRAKAIYGLIKHS